MSNPGEWIDFAELCARVPGKSPRTLRRYIKARLISFRQLVRGGRMQFNWRTVERELAAMESSSVHAGHLAAMPADYPPDLVDEVRKLRELIEGLAVKLNGIPADVFAGEQRRAG
jgi:hypothetical protein